MPASPTASPDHIKDVNTRYHDAAAHEYDAKWGIDFGTTGQEQVRQKLIKALGGRNGASFGRGLEIGSGTGYFSLNLLQIGAIESLTATDISPGILERLASTAAGLGLQVETVQTEAEVLPFEDESFDLVFGHAVLHHIPDLDRAFAEFRRVLKPGGLVAFCGEPSRTGDRLAAYPKRAALAFAPVWRTVMRARKHQGADGSWGKDEEAELEPHVDVHAFSPQDLEQAARAGGFTTVRIKGEELAASWFGWANRTLESTAEPSDVPWLWRRYAFHGYLALQRVDRALLEPYLPPAIFYNLLISAS